MQAPGTPILRRNEVLHSTNLMWFCSAVNACIVVLSHKVGQTLRSSEASVHIHAMSFCKGGTPHRHLSNLLHRLAAGQARMVGRPARHKHEAPAPPNGWDVLCQAAQLDPPLHVGVPCLSVLHTMRASRCCAGELFLHGMNAAAYLMAMGKLLWMGRKPGYNIATHTGTECGDKPWARRVRT